MTIQTITHLLHITKYPLVLLKSYSLRNTDTDFFDVVCISEDGTDNSRDNDMYLKKYCFTIIYHVVLCFRYTHTQFPAINQLIDWDSYVPSTLWSLRDLLFPPSNLSNMVILWAWFLAALLSIFTSRGELSPTQTSQQFTGYENHLKRKQIQIWVPCLRRTQRPDAFQFEFHTPFAFFFYWTCAQAVLVFKGSLQTKANFNYNPTTCLLKKSHTSSHQQWLHQLRAVVQVKTENTLHLQALRSLHGFCPSPA